MGNVFSADKLWGHRYVTEYVPDWEAGNRKSVEGEPTTILTPPPGCKKVQIYSNADILVRTDGRSADALSQLIPGSTVTVLDCTPGVPVTAVCVGGQEAVVYATPMIRKGDPLTRHALTLSGGAALSADSFTAIVLQSSLLKGHGGLIVDAEVSSP